MNRRQRISLGMTLLESVQALGRGNPGAITVMASMMREARAVDPDSLFGPLAPLLALDTLGCYESRIWMLFKDVCGQDLVKTMAVLRGHQLGIIGEDQFNHAVDNRGEGLNPEAVLEAVQVRLPRFGKVAAE